MPAKISFFFRNIRYSKNKFLQIRKQKAPRGWR